MPYKNEAKQETPIYKMPKGMIAKHEDEIEGIVEFYNNFPSKIKASNIFPKMVNGSTTGIFMIVVFYDK